MSNYEDLILVADNHFGTHQPEVIADWMLRNDATASRVDTETLQRLAEDDFPEDGEERSWVIEDLYMSEIQYDGETWYLWNHPDGMDAWLVPDGFDWGEEEF